VVEVLLLEQEAHNQINLLLQIQEQVLLVMVDIQELPEDVTKVV
jgi:hypothetical protein